MKIMIINTLYHPHKVGGAEVSVQLLAETLAQRGHQVQVLCLTPDPQRSEQVINGVSVCYLPLANRYWPFDGQPRSCAQKICWHIKDYYNRDMRMAVMDEILAFSPDIVHTNNIAGFSVSVWSAAKACGVKILHTSRDYYLFHHNATLFSEGQNQDPDATAIRMMSVMKKRLSCLVDGYVGISQFICEMHRKAGFFPNAHHSFIYNTVPAVECAGESGTAGADNLRRIGFIGKLSPEKGFDDFCALARHYRNRSGYAFYAAGRVTEDNPLVSEARQCGVTLLGFASPGEFMRQVDVVVLPVKWHEPFGRVVVESIFHGKVVLTNRMGGVGELASLLPNIYFMEETSVDKVIKNAKPLCPKPIGPDMLAHFTPSWIAQKYEQAYRNVLGA
ncbi:glycosyltransferase family 4 protein [Dickeya poaceiphila]|uniref:Glycosyltransferase family 4 protein n=1 Tax=Dickeya poaceiphila TaxID=568768 RepID=A0A5B8I8J9_9GAMM|nr:glycosyltransferase family 4 protein [Dickeya poaceiphila]QDX30593.1 glycosyltransferase family 4 protein [Dickeya poaceiphila]